MTDDVTTTPSTQAPLGRSSRLACVDSLLLFFGSLALCRVLAQHTLYGPDGWRLLRRIDSEDFRDNLHVLYKPMAIGAKRAGESLLGLQVYESVVWLSAVGVALAVAFWHRAFLTLGLGRSRSAVAASLCAVSPGPLFFGTVVELHGPFLAFAGLASWITAGMVHRPGVWRAGTTGVAIALAYAAHSSGAFLVTGLVIPVLAEARRRGASWGRCARAFLVAGLVAGGGSLGARLLAEWLGTLSDPGKSLEFFKVFAGAHVSKPELIPGAFWNEVIVPFLPAIVTAFAMARGLTLLGLFVAAFVYGILGWLLLGDFDERGAYSLPLVFAISWVVVGRLRIGAGVALVVVAAVLSIAMIRDHDRRPTELQARALGELPGVKDAPFLLVAGFDDFALRFIEYPDLELLQDYFDLLDLALLDPSEIESQIPLLSQVLLMQAKGRPIVLLDDSIEQMDREFADEDPERRVSGRLLLAELRRSFEFVRIVDERLDGYRLSPK